MNARDRARNMWASGGSGRRMLVIALVLVAIAVVIWLSVMLAHGAKGSGGAGGFGGGPGGGGRRPSATVGVATATTADIPITLDALGTVTPAATVTVVPQVSGVITKILFKEGQMVRKGQQLAEIDPRPLQMALLQAQGNLARDQAQLENANVLLSRDKTLLAQDSIARQDVDTQQALVHQLQGTVTTDKAAVGSAQLNLGYSRIIAPVAGRVGLRVVDIGNYIGAGAAGGLVVLTEVAPIDVQFTVPQDDVPRIQAQAAQGQLAVTAFDRTKTVTLDTGTFSTLDNVVDTTTGTVKAKARFANAKGALFPSQFVNVRLELETLKNVVVVPVTAVRTGANGDFVWKLQPDKTVSIGKVTRGPGTPTMVSITQGLTAGEKVITEGGDRLTDGASVKLPGDKPGAGGGGAMQACAADGKKLCAGKEGRDMFMCMRQNSDKLSPGCKAALASRRHKSADSSGGGGGTPGAGGAPEAASTTTTTTTTTTAPAGRHGGGAAAGASAAPSGGGGQAMAGSGGGGGGGGGGFTPSPEMLAAREAMMKACGADAKKVCAGQEGREMFMCMRENADKLSPSCKDAMAKMPHRRPQPEN